MSLSEIISYSISVVVVIVAVWQTIKNNDLKKYIRTEAMEVYKDTGILLGSAQSCLDGLQKGNTNLVIQDAGRVEGMAQSLLTRSIKNIHHHFDYTRKDVDDWIKNNKIHPHHKNDFLEYAEK